MIRAALGAVAALAACHEAAEPRDRAVPAILGLHYGMRPGLRPSQRPSSQDELLEVLSAVGARLECGGEWSNELGVHFRGCSGTIPIAGCAIPISATLERYLFEDGVPGLNEVRLAGPELGDCGPRLEPAAAWPFADPSPPPWTFAVEQALVDRVGRGASDGADRRWRTRDLVVLLSDARLAPCPGLTRCRSYAWFAAPGDRSAAYYGF